MEPAEPSENQRIREAEDHVRLRAPVVYEVIRLEGVAELARPVRSLWWSGVAAGIAISSSLLAKGLLQLYLPDAPWRPLVANFGYCVGFLIVILGRLQLFTENTITVVLPVLAAFNRRNILCMMRLWAVVFAANLTGTFFVALLSAYGMINPEGHLAAFLEVARHFADKTFLQALLQGVPAGFFVAAIVWILPSVEGSEFWVIIAITYLIALGDFAHVIVGSSEVFLVLLVGELSVANGLAGLLLPALIGNIIGGTGLFALLAYAQVEEEL